LEHPFFLPTHLQIHIEPKMASQSTKWFSATFRRNLLRASQLAVGVPVVGFGGLYLWTRRCSFEPFGPTLSPLYQHPVLKIINPRNNPSSDDCCVRPVPFSEIKPELLDDARRGGSRLIEAFSGGMWGGYGSSIAVCLAKDEANMSARLRDPAESHAFDQGRVKQQ
jgi:hypothetical protein